MELESCWYCEKKLIQNGKHKYIAAGLGGAGGAGRLLRPLIAHCFRPVLGLPHTGNYRQPVMVSNKQRSTSVHFFLLASRSQCRAHTSLTPIAIHAPLHTNDLLPARGSFQHALCCFRIAELPLCGEPYLPDSAFLRGLVVGGEMVRRATFCLAFISHCNLNC